MSSTQNGPRAPTRMTGAKVTVVLGAQWGDEGKGKLVDILSTDADMVCRCQGGNNAGHTVVVESKEYFFHMVPSGLIQPKAVSVIGNGVVIHIPQFFDELQALEAKGVKDWQGRLLVSDRAHIVFDLHQESDKLREGGKGGLGTTKKGIGPTYASKAQRIGLRICDLVGDFKIFEQKFQGLVSHFKRLYPDLSTNIQDELEKYKIYAEKIRPLVCDTVSYMHKALQNESAKIIVEGANALMLDIDFGTYPYVTSSSCAVGAVCTGLGIPPTAIGDVYGVTKAYTTRVGHGGFPTELKDDTGDKMQRIGKEFGVTTGRKRRCGWLDLVMIKYSHMINNFTSLVIAKLDILDTFEEVKIGISYKHKGKSLESFPASVEILDEIEVEYITLPGWMTSINHCRTFNELPANAQAYIRKIEEITEIPVKWVGVGKSRDAMISVF